MTGTNPYIRPSLPGPVRLRTTAPIQAPPDRRSVPVSASVGTVFQPDAVRRIEPSPDGWPLHAYIQLRAEASDVARKGRVAR